MSDEVKTSVRLDDPELTAAFASLAYLRGLRPHELARVLVEESLRYEMKDPIVADTTRRVLRRRLRVVA